MKLVLRLRYLPTVIAAVLLGAQTSADASKEPTSNPGGVEASRALSNAARFALSDKTKATTRATTTNPAAKKACGEFCAREWTGLGERAQTHEEYQPIISASVKSNAIC